MRFLTIPLLAAAVPLLAAVAPFPAPAEAAPPPDPARYSLLPAKEGGFVRLDRQSGTMSLCRVEGADLDCRLSADERSAMQAEINRLAGEVDRLKAQLAALGAKPGDADINGLATRELNRMRGVIEDMMRRLMAIVRALTPHDSAAPDRSGHLRLQEPGRTAAAAAR